MKRLIVILLLAIITFVTVAQTADTVAVNNPDTTAYSEPGKAYVNDTTYVLYPMFKISVKQQEYKIQRLAERYNSSMETDTVFIKFKAFEDKISKLYTRALKDFVLPEIKQTVYDSTQMIKRINKLSSDINEWKNAPFKNAKTEDKIKELQKKRRQLNRVYLEWFGK